MSEENVELRTQVGEGASRAGVLVRYRYFAGDVNEHLTVFEDGAVKLDERHRSRDPIWLRLDAAELDWIRVALTRLLARTPAPRTSGWRRS